MTKDKGLTTGLSGRGRQIETGREDGCKPESGTKQILERPVSGGRVIIEIAEPYLALREGLKPTPNGCSLWTRSNGEKWVLFPDGSKHAPDKVGFSAEAWQSAVELDTRPRPDVLEEEEETAE